MRLLIFLVGYSKKYSAQGLFQMTAQTRPAHLQLKTHYWSLLFYLQVCTTVLQEQNEREPGPGQLVQLTIQCQIAVHSTICFIGVFLNIKLNHKQSSFRTV